jgi:hypothetical protein
MKLSGRPFCVLKRAVNPSLLLTYDLLKLPAFCFGLLKSLPLKSFGLQRKFAKFGGNLVSAFDGHYLRVKPNEKHG